MKIYNKIVFDYNFNVVEEDSYEYDGDVALCDGGGGGDASSQASADAQANSEAGSIGGNTSGFGGVSDAGWGQDDAYGNLNTNASLSATQNADMAIDASQSPLSQAQIDAAPLSGTALTNNLNAAKSSYWSAVTGYAKNVFGSIFGLLGVVAAPDMGVKATSAVTAYSNYTNLDKSKATLDQAKAAYDAAKSALDAAFPGQTVSLNADTGQVSVDGRDLGAESSGNSPEAVNAAFAKYDKIVAQASGQTLSSGGTNVSNLSLEDQLKQEQLDILRKQSSESDALTKLVYQAAGIVKDSASGEWRKATEEEKVSFMTPAEKQEYDIYKQTLDRQQKALAGELPISPALEKEITDWNAQSDEELTRRLGSGYATSTPGIQSQENQNIRTGLLREEARRGQIASGQSQISAWQASQANSQANQYNALTGIPNRTSGLLTGYSNALVPYAQANQLSYQSNRDAQILADTQAARRQATKDENRTGMWSAVGTLGGYLFG